VSTLHPSPPFRLDRSERDVLWRFATGALADHAAALHCAAIADPPLGTDAQGSAEASRLVFEIFDALGWDRAGAHESYELPLPRGALVQATLWEGWHRQRRATLHYEVDGPFSDGGYDRDLVDADLDDLSVLDRLISRLVEPEVER
jgi:hypothetical protein